MFEVHLDLTVGECIVDSNGFKDIKILKATKNEPERLVISTYDALLSTDTTIEVKNIISIDFTLKHHIENK